MSWRKPIGVARVAWGRHPKSHIVARSDARLRCGLEPGASPLRFLVQRFPPQRGGAQILVVVPQRGVLALQSGVQHLCLVHTISSRCETRCIHPERHTRPSVAEWIDQFMANRLCVHTRNAHAGLNLGTEVSETSNACRGDDRSRCSRHFA